MNKHSKSIIPKGTFTRCLGKSGQQTVISDRASHTPISGLKSQTLALVEGDIISYQAKNSFTLHGGTTHELIDFQVIATAHKALVITILLKGKLDFGYDDLTFGFDAEIEPFAVVVNLTKPSSFHRKVYKGNNVTKLNIVVPLNWIESRSDNDNINRFIMEHLANFQLIVNKQLLDLTIELIKLSSPSGFIEKMQIEALTQMLLLEVFKQLDHFGENTELLKVINVNDVHTNKVGDFDKKFDQLLVYIEANLASDISFQELADFAVMSISSLQRKFKATCGSSVQSYIRRRRLDLAKQQLERGLITITEAAYSAGYRHPSNFTNAFKKMFGYPPQETIKK